MLDYLKETHALGDRTLQILEGKSFILHKRQCLCLLEKLRKTLKYLVKTVESCRDKERVAEKCREVFKEIYLVVQNVKNFVEDCCYDDENNFILAAIRVAAHKERFYQYHVKLEWCILLIGRLEDGNFYGNRMNCQNKLQAFAWERLRSSVDSSMVDADEKDLKTQLQYWITKPGDHQAICRVPLIRFKAQVQEGYQEVPEPISRPRLKKRNRIGEGGFGSVYKVKWKGQPFAVKKFKILDKEKSDAEVRILGDCCHPNIVNLILAHKKDRHQFIMMERLPMHLQSYIEQKPHRKNNPFHHLEVVEMISQVCEGMIYLNLREVSHRDLKPANILVKIVKDNPNFVEMQLADFGVAKERNKGLEKSSTSVNTPNTGTTLYRAPEMTQKGSKTRLPVSSLKADIYSFAVTCSCILTGREPLGDEVRSNKRPILPEDCPPALASLLQWCWRQEPSERPRDFSKIRTELRKVKASLLSEILTVDEEYHDQRPRVPSETPGELPVREPPLANNGSETFRRGDRRLNILVLGDSDLVENVVWHICGAASRNIELQHHVPSLTESRNSWPPLCLYSDTKGIDRSNFTDVRAFVNARNGGWLQKRVESLWQDEIIRAPASLPDSTLRLHSVWFVCTQVSDLPNRFKWLEISNLYDLPVQILVIAGTQKTPDHLVDSTYNKIFEHRSWYFPNAQKLEESVVKEHLIVKVFLTDGDLKEKLWRVCWAAKTRAEIEYAAKIIKVIRKELGPGGIPIPIGVGGASITKKFSLSQSGKFIVNILSTYWDIPQEAIHGVLQRITTFKPAPNYAIIIKRCEFVKFCLQVAAIILYNAGKNRPEFMYNWDFTSEFGFQLLDLAGTQECYNDYFPSSVDLSSYDKMETEDIRDFLQSIFERKPCPLVSGDRNRSIGSKFVSLFSRGRTLPEL